MDDGQVLNRSEFLFFFETVNNNPNGNPLFNNHPRIDESTGICYVTSNRLKRTIRDYLRDHDNQMVLINNYQTIPESYLEKRITFPSGIKPSNISEIKQTIMQNFIDSRLFGLCFPLSGSNKSLEYYGPVQLTYGKSFFPVQIKKIKGTAAFASKSGKTQRSFRAEYIIPYALFGTHGIINEKSAISTKLRKNDIKLFDKAIWNGTNSLHSRTKIGYKSRLYLRIEYSKKNFQINLNNNIVKIRSDVPDELIRNIDQLKMDCSLLIEQLKRFKKNIRVIYYSIEGLEIMNFPNLSTLFDKLGIEHQEVHL
ncbi:MAG: type I-B CRISPR-associated protein Cas7/Csh2 [Promethearchaeota archaeon]